MTIGELNRKIKVLEYRVTRDEYGGESGEWVEVRSAWAKVQPSSGTEYLRAQQVEAEHTTKFTLRFTPHITVLHRLVYADRTYEIIAVGDLDTSHRWTVITAKEMVSYRLQRKAEKG